jgi:hypothetical protein
MHVMEDEGSKSSSAALDNLPKTNGSPTPCQNPVSALDGEKKGECGQENVATATSKDESYQKNPSYELQETSKVVTAEEEAVHKDKESMYSQAVISCCHDLNLFSNRYEIW